MEKTKHTRDFYLANGDYSFFLDSQNAQVFDKYIKKIIERTSYESNILDVGCGTGTVLNILRGLGYQNLHGIEVSETSIQLARHKGIVCEKYDGNTFPFDDAIFDLVGSINVLEHTDDPKLFLDEEYRILKSGGHLVVICPNFLSVTNNYHKQTRGILQKMENLAHLIMSILTRSTTFRKMEMTISQHFQPDDDAVNITNPIAIKSWADSKSLKLVYSSAFQVEKGKMLSLIDKTPLSVFFGSCFFVFQKN